MKDILYRCGSGVLLTAKGFPDITARRLLSQLQALLHPHGELYVLCDSDPYGFNIAVAWAGLVGEIPEEESFPCGRPRFRAVIWCSPDVAHMRYGVALNEITPLTAKDLGFLGRLASRVKGALKEHADPTAALLSQEVQKYCEVGAKFELDAFPNIWALFADAVGKSDN